MPPATFANEENRIAFYNKYKQQQRDKYKNDPEFREQCLLRRKKVYLKDKENGNYEKQKIACREYYHIKKAKMLAEAQAK